MDVVQWCPVLLHRVVPCPADKTECALGYICEEGSTAEVLCPAGKMCPSPSEMITCRGLSSFCPEGTINKPVPCRLTWVPNNDHTGEVCDVRFFEYGGKCIRCKTGSTCADKRHPDYAKTNTQYEDVAATQGYWQTRDIVSPDWSADEMQRYLSFHRCAERDVQMDDGTTEWKSLCDGGLSWDKCHGNNTGTGVWVTCGRPSCHPQSSCADAVR